MMATTEVPVLELRDVVTQLPTRRGVLTAVDHVSFAVAPGESFGLVGESGSGKSLTCRSILGLIPKPGRVVHGAVFYQGRDLVRLPKAELDQIRGRDISMIVQDPVNALNPVMKVGDQLVEVLVQHRRAASKRAARARALDLLRLVGIAAPERRLNDYPWQFSGGMCQRVVIALALACEPTLILADEPTTALDVTVQDQILKLLVRLQTELHVGLVLVTHDMGVVAQTCQRVAVMYAGQIVELAETPRLFAAPRHPYTRGLLDCAPRLALDGARRMLQPIPGSPPDLLTPPPGCRFHPRCALASDECRQGTFPLREVAPGHFSACIKHEQVASQAPGGLPVALAGQEH